MRTSDIQETLKTTTYRDCKMLCRLRTDCMTVSMEKDLQNGISCSLSSNIISRMLLMFSQGSFSFASDNSSLFLGNDGLFYELFTTTKTRLSASEDCETTSDNGKLIMPKDRLHFDSLENYRRKIKYLNDSCFMIMNLFYDEATKLTWGDGTKFTDTEISKYEIFYEFNRDKSLVDKILETDLLNGNYKAFLVTSDDDEQTFSGATDEDMKAYYICQRDPLGIH
ncbi:UNVERIFIED_CONTAM: hypothetical protein RMT77_008538 [Armadillidium vulgare]